MISTREVTACVNRLATVLPMGPDRDSKAMKSEVMRQYAIQCSSVEFAERLTDRIIEMLRWFPTPSEVVAIAEQLSQQSANRQLGAAGCPHCRGTGFSPAFGVPVEKGRLTRLDVEALRVEIGDEGWVVRNGQRVPKASHEVALIWSRQQRREIHNVAEVCLCRGV